MEKLEVKLVKISLIIEHLVLERTIKIVEPSQVPISKTVDTVLKDLATTMSAAFSESWDEPAGDWKGADLITLECSACLGKFEGRHSDDLKDCPREECGGRLYDYSRNRRAQPEPTKKGTWPSSEALGFRVKCDVCGGIHEGSTPAGGSLLGKNCALPECEGLLIEIKK